MAVGRRRANWFLMGGGIVMVLCGVVALFAPHLFLGFLTVWAGVGFIIAGFAGIGSYIQGRGVRDTSGLSLFMAVLDLVVGALLIVYPFAFMPAFSWLVGVSFIAYGVLEIAGTFPFAALIPESRPIMIISGVLTFIIGLVFIIWPASFAIWVAAFALVRGITLIVVAITSR